MPPTRELPTTAPTDPLRRTVVSLGAVLLALALLAAVATVLSGREHRGAGVAVVLVLMVAAAVATARGRARKRESAKLAGTATAAAVGANLGTTPAFQLPETHFAGGDVGGNFEVHFGGGFDGGADGGGGE